MKAIEAEFWPATATKPRRATASDHAGNTFTVSADAPDNLYPDGRYEAVRLLCEKMNWKGELVVGDLGERLIFVWCEFERIYV